MPLDHSYTTDTFPYGTVITSNSTVVGVQYENVGEPCLALRYELDIEGLAERRAVVSDAFLKQFASAVRGNTQVIRSFDISVFNAFLEGYGLEKWVRDSRDYDNPPRFLDEAIRTCVLYGKRFETLVYASNFYATRYIWENEGSLIMENWVGFPTHNQAIACILHLPGDTRVFRL